MLMSGAAAVRRKSTTAEEGRDPDLDPAAAVSKGGPGKKRQAKKPKPAAAQRMRIQVRRVVELSVPAIYPQPSPTRLIASLLHVYMYVCM